MRKFVSRLYSKIGLSRPHRPAQANTPPQCPDSRQPLSVNNGESELEGAGTTHAVGPGPSTLESLPAELRSQILLYLSDLDALRAAVHASPVLHQQYLADRRVLLGKHLRETLGDQVFIDAFAVQISASLRPPHGTLSIKTIGQFMNTYRQSRLEPDTILDECTAEDLIGMASFYALTIRPLTREFPQLFLRNIEPSLEIYLSGTERARVMRSLYRFQIWCNLFGIVNDIRPVYCHVDSTEILRLFFGVFNPWEVEEVACIYALLKDKYEQIFNDIKWDLHRDNPRFSNWPYIHTPDGAFDFDYEISREFWREGVISRGLQFYREVMAISDHETLVRTTQVMITGGPNTIEDTLSFISQGTRRDLHPSDHDRAERAREKLAFVGDSEDHPPLAWVMMWRGRYSNRYGDSIPDSLKSWGFVFWDVKRLVRTGAKGVLKHTLTGFNSRP